MPLVSDIVLFLLFKDKFSLIGILYLFIWSIRSSGHQGESNEGAFRQPSESDAYL